MNTSHNDLAINGTLVTMKPLMETSHNDLAINEH